MVRSGGWAARLRESGGSSHGVGCCGLILVTAILVMPGSISVGSSPSRWNEGPVSPTLRSPFTLSAGPTAGLPNPGVWSELPVASGQPTARSHFALAFDPVGGLGVLFGGLASNGSTLGDTWVNDGDFPTTWVEYTDRLNVSPPPLADASLTFEVSTGAFLLFGGRLSNGSLFGGTWKFTGFQWFPVANGPSGSPPPQAGAPFAFDSADGYAVLESSAGSASTWRFQSGTWSLMSTGSTPTLRQGAALVDDTADGGLVLFGGSGLSGVLNDTWTFVSGQWHRLSGSGPPAGAGPRLAYDPRGPIVLLLLANPSEPVWGFRGMQWTAWTDGSTSGPTERSGAGFYFDSIVNFDILFGGTAPNGTTVADKWGWNVPPSPPEPTLGSAPIQPGIAGILIAVATAPVVIAWWLRRRPPRVQPTAVPRPTSSSSGI